MKYNSLVLIGLAARSSASPQADSGAVTAKIAPQGGILEGCQTTYPGRFQVRTQRLSDQPLVNQQPQACGADKSLVMTLNGGVLTDGKSRTGYVASNYQFQFDGPPQSGSIYTAGFSLCGNGSLALGSSAVFYQCLSGSFYNLYDRNWAAQCEPILMMAVPCSDGSGSGSAADIGAGDAASSSSQSPGTISQIGDGQPQAPVQPQTPNQPGQAPEQPVQAPNQPGQTPDQPGQAPNQPGQAPEQPGQGPNQPQSPVQPGAPVVSQIGDGQPQAPVQPPAPVVSEINDGQPEAPAQPQTPAQPQAPTQPQAPDQPQAPVVSEINDGQPEAPVGNAPPAETPATGQTPGGQSPSEGGSPSQESSAPSATSAAPSSGQDNTQAPEATKPAYEVSQGMQNAASGIATALVFAMAGSFLFL
ncbi:hypothetical protein XA68_15511 [Ophiocordyceps unilateralis]|uniref:Cell wall mannoprotein PIR1-like C-terminal domain-containing protein n=1 Tax=Ophiocordyceps unilateralis TaxID=268505 RepID=A0A2A9P7B2_OPHUN|nr:hypothetical protein XA68_15511 [Ophiocordyceps unilateralis]